MGRERGVDLGLGGRTVLVTAASEGLGLACAEAFAAEGARLVICARRKGPLAEAAGHLTGLGARGVVAIPCDVDAPQDRDRLFASIAGHGPLDAAVLNMGNPVGGWVDDLAETAWEDAYRKWRAMVELGRAAVRAMRARDGGAVVYVLSRTAVQPERSLALSSMVRAALAAWTKMLADEAGPHGVRVVGVLPGLTRTAHIEAGLVARGGPVAGLGHEPKAPAVGDDAGATGAVPFLEALVREAAAREGVPLGRLGTPASFGRLVAFLASPACDYVTGSLVRFDGGAVRIP